MQVKSIAFIICFQDQLSLNAGHKYCRMLQEEHSAILSTFIKLPIVFKTFVLSIFEWRLKTGFTVCIDGVRNDSLLSWFKGRNPAAPVGEWPQYETVNWRRSATV